jgi:hypothetical protein
MSFSKTISVFAALASIFSVGIASWKIVQDGQSTPATPEKPVEEVTTKYESHITELQQQISGLEKQLTNTNPPPAVELPQPTVVKQVAPPTPNLPPTTPPPPVPPAPQQP